MRNLRLLYKKTQKYEKFKVRLMSHHPFENITYLYDDENQIVKSINHNEEKLNDLCCYNGVMAMEFIQLNDCLCLSTDNGEIIQYNLNSDDFEAVGLISDGIETMSWSPDQELVVFITKSYNMILMFSTYDILAECSLHEKAEKEFLTVGWGAKETQFHGSVGKDARKKQEIKIQDVEVLDKTITCCWRGDGEYFAVNFVGSNARMFKVFNKEGVMQYVSEVNANLESPIAWRPSGLWIAKPEIQEKNNKYVIALFERNGLKHYELVLPFSHANEQVVSLCWNQDSDILLIESQRKEIHCLYFYTISNYHWYLKHSIEYSGKVFYCWSQNYAESKQLHIIDNRGEYSCIKFDFVVNYSNGSSENDESIVAVIDGKKLLLTNFKSQMVPPPMSSLQVPFETSINFVIFLQNPCENFDSNSFITIDNRNNATMFRCILNDAINGKRLIGAEKAKNFQLKIVESISHIQWMNSSKLLFVSSSSVYIYCIDSETIVNNLQLEDSIGSIQKVNNSLYVAELLDGTLIGIEIINNDLYLSNKINLKIPEFCDKIIATSFENEINFYSLNNLKKKLYFNKKEIASEVTSFSTTNDGEYLIFTTISELKFIKVNNPEEIIDKRRIERGSRIVALVKDKSQIIFQLPRGNLETISPRILSLNIIKKYLAESNYKSAFDLLRKERINLNLIVDLQPRKFFDELILFIKQVDNVNWINLFLTELKNEDVTVTMYKYCCNSRDAQDIVSYSTESKINFICEKMLDIFKELDDKKYLLPSITCNVKNGKIECALQMIWELKKCGNDKDADDSVKYLLYLIDINVLYNIALGMYDYQLVMFVAQKSQKDPKEYIPFLRELNNLDSNYAMFKIDCHLKRYTKAITHIAPLCTEDESKFNECIELIKKHDLYESGMKTFVNQAECYQKICIIFADQLRIKGKLLDASLMYERGTDYQQSLSSARNILDWKRCLMLSRKCNYSNEQIKELAMKLVNSLNDLNRYQESSEILRQFNDDKKLLIETYMKGRMYSEAIMEISLSGNTELIESVFKPFLSQVIGETLKTINEEKSSYLYQKERLLSIRGEKIRKLQNPQEDDDDDMFSDTTSINSQSSRNTVKTFKSNKNRRKHERKLLNLKEGNRFEDIALLDSLWRLVTKIINNEYQNSIKDIIVSCIEMNMDEDGRNVQKSYKDLLLKLKFTLDEIWIPEMLSAGKYPETEEEMETYNMNSTANKLSYDLIKPEQRFKPKMNIIDFEMEMFRESSKN